MTREDDLAKMLGEVAKKQAGEADELYQRARTEPELEALKPLDENERAELATALFGENVVAIESRRRWIRPLAAVAAIAASLLLVVYLGKTPEEHVAYRMTVASGAQNTRSSTSAVAPEYSEGSRLELIFQPDKTIAGEVRVESALAKDGALAEPIVLPIERSADGAIRVRAFIGRELPISDGEYRLLVSLWPKGQEEKFEYFFRVKNLPREQE